VTLVVGAGLNIIIGADQFRLSGLSPIVYSPKYKECRMKLKMFATARRYEGVNDPETATKKVDEVFVPLISALPGFVEYFWIDLGNGAMMSITVFESLSEAINANEKSRIWVKEHLSSILASSVRIEAGSIVAYKGK
jgi:hypothetical protein